MSPGSSRAEIADLRFPRVSGDEPGSQNADAWFAVFSPRERG